MDCLSAADRQERVTLIREAVVALAAQRAPVDIDAGNARWHSPEEMAPRLTQAGIGQANGCSLNVSNFQATSVNVAYGERPRPAGRVVVGCLRARTEPPRRHADGGGNGLS